MLNNNLIMENIELKTRIHKMEADLNDKDVEIMNLRKMLQDKNVGSLDGWDNQQYENASAKSQNYGSSNWEVYTLKNQIESLQREVSDKNDQIRRLEQGYQYSRNASTYRTPYSIDVFLLLRANRRNRATLSDSTGF